MKKSFTKIVSVVIAVMLAVTAMACFASAAGKVEGCECKCCQSSANSSNSSTTDFQGDRDIYLVLDVSGSMSGTPIKKLKEAAKQFCATMMDDMTGTNRIAIVTYGTKVATYNFSSDYDELAATIDGLTAKGSTAMYDALMAVKDINEKVGNQNATKHVVVMADGLPNEGATLSSGHYTSKDSNMYYKYGNAVYSTAAGMWYDYNIYSIGFFHNLGGSQLKFGSLLMNDIQNSLYLEVFSPEELLGAFTGVADSILGACICEEGCDCGLYGCCECCTGEKAPCINADVDGSCNCAVNCTCGAVCTCGEGCTCNACANANDDGSCNCAVNCTCGAVCTCGEGCTCSACANANDDGSCNCAVNCTCGDNCTCGPNCACCVEKSIPQTGDSMLGIAAAAVIMVAGIALVASKKRED